VGDLHRGGAGGAGHKIGSDVQVVAHRHAVYGAADLEKLAVLTVVDRGVVNDVDVAHATVVLVAPARDVDGDVVVLLDDVVADADVLAAAADLDLRVDHAVVLDHDPAEPRRLVVQSRAAVQRPQAQRGVRQLVVGDVDVVALVRGDGPAQPAGRGGVGEIVVGDVDAIGAPEADVVLVERVLDAVPQVNLVGALHPGEIGADRPGVGSDVVLHQHAVRRAVGVHDVTGVEDGAVAQGDVLPADADDVVVALIAGAGVAGIEREVVDQHVFRAQRGKDGAVIRAAGVFDHRRGAAAVGADDDVVEAEAHPVLGGVGGAALEEDFGVVADQVGGALEGLDGVVGAGAVVAVITLR